MSISLVCYIVALVLLILAAIGVPASRFSLLAAGMAFWLAGEHITG